MSRESIKGNTREVIRAHNFEKSLEYKANKTSNWAQPDPSSSIMA